MSKASRVKLNSDHIEKLNQLKFEICYVIDNEMTRYQWTQLELAFHVGATQSCINKVVNKKVDELSFNQLFRYLVILKPEFRCIVSPY